ncbi:helix-turn-helix domain-containing protein [Flavobacteriales bacterium]|nr:helix-turn-helix domain-containing protein [Flavobacteriales bacterium]
MIKIDIEGMDEIRDSLSELKKIFLEKNRPANQQILDNKGLMEYLKISSTKAQKLRNEGKLAFSKDSRTDKIWFRLSDVLEYLDSCYYKRF